MAVIGCAASSRSACSTRRSSSDDAKIALGSQGIGVMLLLHPVEIASSGLLIDSAERMPSKEHHNQS